MEKNNKNGLITITESDFNKAIDLYWKWKDLNSELKKFYTRGVNLHEGITEIICCYVNDFQLSLGKGSEDAVDPKTNQLIQVKGSSNWNKDLTSFGPESKFDCLHFVRLSYEKDIMYLYQIPTYDLDNIMVNKTSSVKDFKKQGKRPRFSLIEKCINKHNINEYATVDLIKRKIKYLNK